MKRDICGFVFRIADDIKEAAYPEVEPWQILFAVKGLREIEALLDKHAKFDKFWAEREFLRLDLPFDLPPGV